MSGQKTLSSGTNYKQVNHIFIKTVQDITDEDLKLINQFTQVEISAEQIYVQKFIACHNAIDRDGDRFNEDLLDDYIATFPGRSFMPNHDTHDSFPLGLVYKSEEKLMTPKEYEELTGEIPRLPKGIDKVKAVVIWVYLVQEDEPKMISKLKYGVCRHGSIGFSADKWEEQEDGYYEFMGPGEAREFSIVYLGAQNGAISIKKPNEDQNKKGDEMAIFKLLSKKTGKEIDDKNVDETVSALLDEKDAKITELTPHADAGKKFRKVLVGDYVKLKIKIGDIPADKPEKKEATEKMAEQLDLEFLQDEIKSLQARVDEKFPAEGQLDPDDPEKTKGADKNPLIPEVEV